MASSVVGDLDSTVMDDSALDQSWTGAEVENGQYMRLDPTVVRSLDLFELSNDAACRMWYSPKDTLYGLLNRCRTAPGKRVLTQWIKKPLLDIDKINERLDIVESLVPESEVCQTLSNLLARFPDIQRITKTFEKNRAKLLDLYKLYQAARLIPKVLDSVGKLADNDQRSISRCLLEPLRELDVELKELVKLAMTTLDIENAKSHEIFIKPSYNPTFANLREQMTEIEAEMQDETSQAATALGLEVGKTIKLENNPQYGYYFRVTNKNEKAIRNRREISVLDSSKNGVKFRTKLLTQLNNSYACDKKDYEKHQSETASEVLKTAMTYLDPLERLCSVMAKLDVLLAFAFVSRNYVRPIILEQDARVLELREARHPCLETHENLSFIPNNVYFEKNKVEFLLITGPNMGGKSTYLRQTGLIVLMAQIGCFVPCSSARLSVVDAIFTRIGASDAQLEGASTFRVEMIEMTSILQAATSKSLILIDELGRGTSTYDGCALAGSIAEHIAQNIRGWCMFATHFHELTALDIDLPYLQNLHVLADITYGRFTLLYQVRPGPCGASFGVHIAKTLNLPKSVIKEAARVLDSFAWSDGEGELASESMEWTSEDKTLSDSSAASFVTEVRRIIRNERIYSTAEEKARALRNLLTTSKSDLATALFTQHSCQ